MRKKSTDASEASADLPLAESEPKTAKESVNTNEPFDFDTFKFKTLADFDTYNAQVRRHNLHSNKPRMIKVPDETFHKKAKVKFQRFDQPENVLKARVRNKDIDWRGQLKPGCTYDLPIPVIQYLNRLAVPVFAEVKTENNGETLTETKQVGERNRFSCQLMELSA